MATFIQRTEERVTAKIFQTKTVPFGPRKRCPVFMGENEGRGVPLYLDELDVCFGARWV